jgi:ferric-dicitrate binding protein FerR (iron transport regulator)
VIGFALTRYLFSGESKSGIPQKPHTITLYVPGGVCSKTILPDNTIVWLNSSSTISYPNNFDGNTRTVELIGEAFFDVTHDETKPFIIQSGDIQVKVLGTSFNFKHYAEDTHAVLAVETGTVTLSAGTSAATTLNAGKYATVDNKSFKTKVYNTPPVSSTKKTTVDDSSTSPKMKAKETYTDQFSSWRDYKMVFRDEPFSNVLNELSRKYNAEFEIQGEEIKDYVYTATFDDMSLEDVLTLLKISAPIDYTIKSLTSNEMNAYGKRRVTIFRK